MEYIVTPSCAMDDSEGSMALAAVKHELEGEEDMMVMIHTPRLHRTPP
jgi:hypothetical protein